MAWIYIFFWSIFFPADQQTHLALDPAASFLEFSVDHLSFTEVRGNFELSEGFWQKRADGSWRLEIKVPVNSFNSGVDLRDETMMEKQYFNAALHPYITFEAITKEKPWQISQLKGSLSIKGQEQELIIPLTTTGGARSFQIEAQFSIDRYAFKVGGSGNTTMGREVRLKVKAYFRA